MTIQLADIEQAAKVIEGRVVRTPALVAESLSGRCGCTVVLKCENLQYTSSFKDRGALNKLSSLTDDQRRRGVVAMSAGNHAQGVAHFATALGIPSTIVMPTNTPFVKIAKTRMLGAKVVQQGAMIDESAAVARELADQHKLTMIHPYDDPLIMAGQGTIALELLAEHPDLDMIVVPIGGGGVISGIAVAAKALKPSIEMVGVEAAAVPSMYCRLNNIAPPVWGATIAEGIAVKTPGELTVPIVKDLVDRVLLVEEPLLEQAIITLLEDQRMVVEGAGAAGLAALLRYPKGFAGKKVGLILCGGNIDSRLLSDVILRGLVRDRRLVRLRIGVPDQPGQLHAATGIIAEAGGNVVEVHHQRAFSHLSIKATSIDIIVETRNADHAAELIAKLKVRGFDVSEQNARPDSW
ncbi:MAG: threonine ammonia-lyase [Geminicoccaceae bacterium]